MKRLNYLLSGDYSYVEEYVRLNHPTVPVWRRCDDSEFLHMLLKSGTIIFYGRGRFAERLIPYMNNLKDRVCFCDLNSDDEENAYHSFRTISVENIPTQKDYSIVICSTKYYDEILSDLNSKGIEKTRIIDIRSCFVCGTGDEYFYEDFIHYEENEVFIDAGCCDLESTVDLYRKCDSLKKVYAFEPDEYNFQVCKQKYERHIEKVFPVVEIYPYGTWSGKTKLHFSATNDGSSHIGEGETTIETASIDEIVDPRDRVTFIKMDVEGAELESLKGAKNTIERSRPKLAICLYHKPEDMWELPMYILELNLNYKFYVRSHSNAENEVVLYAV